MPEGPEVRSIVDVLHSLLTEGCKAVSLIDIRLSPKSKFNDRFPGRELLQFPLKLQLVTCKGKQIFFILQAEDGLKYYLNSTLGMSGRWVLAPEKHSDLVLVWGRIHRSPKLTIKFCERYLYYDDMRHFGNLSFLTEAQYQAKLKTLGPDLLAENVTWETWYTCLMKGTRPNHQICKVLMDQSVVAGIGNYLKAEILYRAKIKPDRLVSELTLEELEILRQVSLYIIRASYQAKGLTVESYWDPLGNRGKFQVLIYQKAVDPNGHPIIKSKFKDKRTTHWCPNVQI